MIPVIHDSKEKYLGLLNDSEYCYVIEERNGMFELELTYNLFSLNWDKLVRGNIIIAHANDTLLNQKFRIYKIGKTIRGKFSVFAKHISYDMQRDMIEGLDIQNQSCEYCLNEIFRNSKFSQKFRGYSDIINAQDYKIGSTKLLSAIGGTKGSILDTFGTGAELLRDNENIHVLNRRGHDNGITIEYSKNLTGLDITEDEEGLITRIRAIAKYTPEGGEETTVATYVDSSNIDKYETPFTETIDFSNKFENGEIPTTAKLEQLALVYFRDNQCDVFKGNYKIQFIPLSKCAGYEDIEDKISLCDTVHIKDYRYNLDDKAKIIKVTYDTLKERYVSMEVGVPRSSLSDVISNNSNTVSRDEVKDIINNSTTKFPNTLPSTPVLSAKVYGFASIELSWTYENKVYYQYELYASKTKNFTSNVFDIIHAGQTSSFLFQAKPNETWYFRVCCVNSHGNRTSFSDQISVTTTKIDDLSNYVNNMAIGDALIGTLSLDRGWVGQLKGNHIDARQLTVTDGNGKRTVDIDSFGNVILDVKKLKIQSKDVATKADIELTSNNLISKFTKEDGFNLLYNSLFAENTLNYWDLWGEGSFQWLRDMNYYQKEGDMWLGTMSLTEGYTLVQKRSFTCAKNEEFTYSLSIRKEVNAGTSYIKILFLDNDNTVVNTYEGDLKLDSERHTYKFTVPDDARIVRGRFGIYTDPASKNYSNLTYINKPCLTRGNHNGWVASPNDNYTTEQVNSLIQQTASEIKTEVAKKTTVDEVKSTIEQNPHSVSIGFNGIADIVEFTKQYFKFKADDGTDIFKASGEEVLITGTKTKVTEALDILNVGANRIISLENHNSLDIVLKDKLGNYYCTPVKIGDFGLEVFGDIFAGGHNLGAEGKQFNTAYIGDFLKSDTGFTNLPNGMLIQWGYTFVGGPNGSQITFPKRFTTTEPVITISPMSMELNQYQQSAWVTGWNQYNFYARCSSETNCKWIAIGY